MAFLFRPKPEAVWNRCSGDERIRYPTLSPSCPSPRPSSTQASWVWGLRLAVCKESWRRNGLTKDKCWTTWKVALSLFQPGNFSSVPKIPDRVVLFHGAAAKEGLACYSLRWPVSEFNSISTVLVSCCYDKIPEVVGLWARLCLGSQLQRFLGL